MRIISSNHDYYDSIRGYGSDPRLVYVRETKEIESPDKQLVSPLLNIVSKMSRWLHGSYGVIAFCGRAFPYYTYEKGTAYSVQELKKLICTTPTFSPSSAKDVLKELDRTGKEKHHSWWYRESWWHRGDLTETNWKHFIEDIDLSIDDDFFRAIHAPVAAMRGDDYFKRPLIINPRLNQFNFATQRDPYTAYQELSMFLGNNMATQMDPEVHVSDVIKAESHGFDKWSFRKRKEK